MFANVPPGFPVPVPSRVDDIVDTVPAVPEREPPSGLAEWRDYKISQAELTPKESLCVKLLLRGLSTKEMALQTGNTEKTLKHHIASIFEKFGVDSRARLFAEIFPT